MPFSRLRKKGVECSRELNRFMKGDIMSDSENVKSLKVSGECVTDKNNITESIKEFWEDIGGVGEVFQVREGCLTLERKDVDDLNNRISREEGEKCVKRQKNGEAAGPDDILHEFYKNGDDVVIDRKKRC